MESEEKHRSLLGDRPKANWKPPTCWVGGYRQAGEFAAKAVLRNRTTSPGHSRSTSRADPVPHMETAVRG